MNSNFYAARCIPAAASIRAQELQRGVLEQIYVKGNARHIILMQVGKEAVLEVIAGPNAKLGMVRLDMKRAVQEIVRLV